MVHIDVYLTGSGITYDHLGHVSEGISRLVWQRMEDPALTVGSIIRWA